MIKTISSVLLRLVTAFLIVSQATFGFAQTASILPQGTTQYFDNNGNPLTSGKVYNYIPGTTTFKNTWQDSAEGTLNANPVVLDAAGRAKILGEGAYRQIVKKANGDTVWDAVTSASGSGSSGSSTGDGDLVGTVKPWAGITAPNQYAFAYGQEVSRTTYSVLKTAITLTTNLNCTSSSTTLSGIADTSSINVGAAVEASCIPAGTTVTSKTSSTVVVSNPANITVAVSATFFPFGGGNGTSTFTLPDLRGYVIAGRDNMGGTAASRLTTTYFGSNTPDAQGATGGGQSNTLATTNLPAYTPSGTIIVTDTRSYTIPFESANVVNTAQSGVLVARSSSTTNVTVGATGTLTSAFTGAAQGGAATPISRVQPTITFNYIIKITPDTNSSVASGVTSLGSMTGDIACGTGLLCTGNNISVNTNTLLASPTASIGVSVVNGSASTAMRSDAAPSLGTPILSFMGGEVRLSWPGSDTTENWNAYGFQGSAISVGSTTTKGLQETINTAYSSAGTPGYDLRITGGQMGTPGSSAYLSTNTAISFPSGQGKAVQIGSMSLNLNPGATSGVTFDSQLILDFAMRGGQINYSTGSGIALEFKPTSLLPVDPLRVIGDTRFSFLAIVGGTGTNPVVKFNNAPGGSGQGIFGSSFDFIETNSATFGDGIAVSHTQAGANFSLNKITARHVHGIGSGRTAVLIGDPSSNNGQVLGRNIYELGISTERSNANGIDSYGSSDFIVAHIQDIISGVPTQFRSGANNNVIVVPYNSNPTADVDGGTNNICIGMCGRAAGNISIGQNSGSTYKDAALNIGSVTATGAIALHIASATGGFINITDVGLKDWSVGVADGTSEFGIYEDRNSGSAGTKRFALGIGGAITTGVWNGSVITGTYGGTGVNNGASTITVGANVTFSGAFTTQFTVSGATNASLPSGTHTLAALDVNETWTGTQSFGSSTLKLNGATSGSLTLNAAAIAGSNTLTLPAGTTDFSATGGISQVVKQTSVGGALTVARLACSDLSDAAATCSSASGGSLVVGTTAISSGSNTRILYNNNGTLGEYTISGSGTQVAMATGSSISGLTVTSSFTATGLSALTNIAAQAANTVVGNATAGSASPTALTMTSCSTAASAVIWTANTGFGCNTSITANAVPAANLTGTTLASGVVTSSLTTVGTIGTGVWQGTAIAGLYGGTGLTTAAIGDIIYASATTPTWSRLADVATGSVLVSGGVNTAPAWSAAITVTTSVSTAALAGTTSITSPLHIGGSAAGASIELRSTSGTGSGDFIKFTGGTNGGTEWARLVGGYLAIGTTSCSNGGGYTNRFCATADFPIFVLTSVTASQSWAWSVGGGGVMNFFDNTNNLNAVTVTPSTLTMQLASTIEATATNAASFFTAGGVGVAKALRVGGIIYAPNLNTTTAALGAALCWTTTTGEFQRDTNAGGCLVSIGAAKTLLGKLPPSTSLDTVMKLSPEAFRYRSDYGDGGLYEQVGFVAEQVASVDERLAARGADGKLTGVRYMQMTATLTSAIQQLKADNDDLRSANDNLKYRLELIERKLGVR